MVTLPSRPLLVGGLVCHFLFSQSSQLTFIFFPIYWVANHPNWPSYFSEGWPWPTNQQHREVRRCPRAFCGSTPRSDGAEGADGADDLGSSLLYAEYWEFSGRFPYIPWIYVEYSGMLNYAEFQDKKYASFDGFDGWCFVLLHDQTCGSFLRF